jgi:DNA-binding LacI/PurR family transcriptional regulator
MAESSSFRYQEIAENIRSRILAGEYKVGEVLPGQRLIAEDLAANRASIKRAIEVLQEEGLLECIPSVGTIVRKVPTERAPVGYLVTNLQDPFHLDMIREIDGLLRALNSGLIVAEGTSARRLLDMGATRIIKAGQLQSTAAEDLVRTVYIGGGPEGCRCVEADNEKGIRLISAHLRGLGHGRIAFATTSIEKLSRQPDLRFELLLRAAADEEQRDYLREHCYTVGSYGEQECAAVIDAILGLREPPTALVCTSDWLAIHIIKQAALRGLAVPADLSVTGFDNIFISSMINPPLTTVSYPIATAAREALRILFDPSGQPAVRVVCDPELVVRQSTAAPGGAAVAGVEPGRSVHDR